MFSQPQFGSTVSRRRFLGSLALIGSGLAAMPLIQACAPAPVAPAATPAPAAAPSPTIAASATAAPAAVAQSGSAAKSFQLSHWVYSSLKLIDSTLQPAPPTQKTGVIEYFDWNVKEYNQATPNTKVDLQFLPHDQTWAAKLSAALVAGTQPDVVQGPVSEAAAYIVQGAVSPIDNYISAADKQDIVEAVVDEATFDGKTYLWPWRLAFGGGIQINATLWKQAGVGNLLPTGDMRNWLIDDCLKGLKATTTPADSSPSVYGIVLMTDYAYQLSQFLYGFGARLYNADETKVALNSPEGVAGLEWLLSLEFDQKVAVPGTAARKNADAAQFFNTHKAATYPSQGAGTKPVALMDDKEMDWYWVPPPNVPGKTPAVQTNTHGHYVMKNKNADQTTEAHNYTGFVVRPAALKVTMQFGMPPARQSLWGQVTDDNQKVGLSFANIAISFGRRASATPINFTLLPRMYQAAFSKQKTAKQALDDFAAEANKAIQDALAQAPNL